MPAVRDREQGAQRGAKEQVDEARAEAGGDFGDEAGGARDGAAARPFCGGSRDGFDVGVSTADSPAPDGVGRGMG